MSRVKLQAIWKLLKQLKAEDGGEWSQVKDWRLLPLADQSLLKIEHRLAVFTPLTQQRPDSGHHAG